VKAAVICFGESSRLFPGDFCGLTIAVNRAALQFRADVWAAGDEPMLRTVSQHVLGTPIWLTTAGTAALARDHGPAWRGQQVVEFESLNRIIDSTWLPWTLFTVTAAVVYAASRGATEVECYGMDWKGEQDADGWKEAGNRSDERWKLEAGLFHRLQDELQKRGCQVTRVIESNL
jgi:hypothetical protein